MKNISKGHIGFKNEDVKDIYSQIMEDENFLTWVVCDKCRFDEFCHRCKDETTDCYNHFKRMCDVND